MRHDGRAGAVPSAMMNLPSGIEAQRAEVAGAGGSVVSSHPLASMAGIEVLRSGGNAVDAAVTMALVLGVVEPWASGIGGGGLMVLHDSADGTSATIDFTMETGRDASPTRYEVLTGQARSSYGWRIVKEDSNLIGASAVAIPGTIRGLAVALERHGTLDWASVFGPAIHYARNGCDVDWQTAQMIASEMRLLQRSPAASDIFLSDGFPLRSGHAFSPGDRLLQPDLADTLERLAEGGPDILYTGELAAKIAKEVRRGDGLFDAEDLEAYRPIESRPLSVRFANAEVLADPGANGASTVLEALAILDGMAVGGGRPDGVRDLHVIAEALRLAFADRAEYLCDPRHSAVSPADLIDSDFISERRALIREDRALGVVPPGRPRGHARAIRPSHMPEPKCTTHLTVADGNGCTVSLTLTLLAAFGSGVVVPGTGILLNNGMQWFDPEPGHANSIAPRKRSLVNMAPIIAVRESGSDLAVGAAGGPRIIAAVTQVATRVLSYGDGVQAALSAPRIDTSTDQLLVDARLADEMRSGLARLGHDLRVVHPDFYAFNFARPNAILRTESGELTAGGEPYAPQYPLVANS